MFPALTGTCFITEPPGKPKDSSILARRYLGKDRSGLGQKKKGMTTLGSPIRPVGILVDQSESDGTKHEPGPDPLIAHLGILPLLFTALLVRTLTWWWFMLLCLTKPPWDSRALVRKEVTPSYFLIWRWISSSGLLPRSWEWFDASLLLLLWSLPHPLWYTPFISPMMASLSC